jgi:hypothetical protein
MALSQGNVTTAFWSFEPPLSALPERLALRYRRTACPFGGLASSQPLSSEERAVAGALASPFA